MCPQHRVVQRGANGKHIRWSNLQSYNFTKFLKSYHLVKAKLQIDKWNKCDFLGRLHPPHRRAPCIIKSQICRYVDRSVYGGAKLGAADFLAGRGNMRCDSTHVCWEVKWLFTARFKLMCLFAIHACMPMMWQTVVVCAGWQSNQSAGCSTTAILWKHKILVFHFLYHLFHYQFSPIIIKALSTYGFGNGVFLVKQVQGWECNPLRAFMEVVVLVVDKQ